MNFAMAGDLTASTGTEMANIATFIALVNMLCKFDLHNNVLAVTIICMTASQNTIAEAMNVSVATVKKVRSFETSGDRHSTFYSFAHRLEVGTFQRVAEGHFVN